MRTIILRNQNAKAKKHNTPIVVVWKRYLVNLLRNTNETHEPSFLTTLQPSVEHQLSDDPTRTFVHPISSRGKDESPRPVMIYNVDPLDDTPPKFKIATEK